MRWIIGIDEVGRGSLAGPVMVCALAMPHGFRIFPELVEGLPKLRDSKQLSASQRECWAAWVKTQPDIHFMVARVYPRGIERMNISQAANLAATRACYRLLPELACPPKPWRRRVEGVHNGSPSINSGRNIKVLLDGGLYLRVNPRSYPRLSASTIVKGDEKFTAIKLASIVAKVARDKFMHTLDVRYPQYGLAIHKGYGTKRHIAAIKKYGPSEIHRATFVKNFVV
ncbi:MAG: ribonuclease HII [bacterium]|nr:ribonuclease HII [bacterium]